MGPGLRASRPRQVGESGVAGPLPSHTGSVNDRTDVVTPVQTRRFVGMVSEYFSTFSRTCTFGCGPLNGQLTAGFAAQTLQFVSDLSEQVAMARLEQRLHSIYAALSPDEISAAVHDARARFDKSPVRDFIPLLVERRVRAQLAEMELRATDRVNLAG